MKNQRVALERNVDESVLKFMRSQLETSAADEVHLFGFGLTRLAELSKKVKPKATLNLYTDGEDSKIVYTYLSNQELSVYSDLETLVPDIKAFRGDRATHAAALLLANRYRVLLQKHAYYYNVLAEEFRSLALVERYAQWLRALHTNVGDGCHFFGSADLESTKKVLHSSPGLSFVRTEHMNVPDVLNQLGTAKGEVYVCLEYQQTKRDNLTVPPGSRIVFGKTIGSRLNPETYIVTNLSSVKTEAARVSRNLDPLNIELYNDEDVNKFTRVSIVSLSRDQALYFRDLWVHKLHSVSAERNFLMLLDGRAFTVFGLQFKNALQGTEQTGNYVHEIYGITCPTKRWQTLNRLYMDLITSVQFREWVQSVEPSLTFLGLHAVKTACLSRLPEVRLNRGPLKIISRKLMLNGSWKLEYLTDFQNKSWRQLIIEWLDYEERLKRIREKRKEHDSKTTSNQKV
jgi:hypothetical protein